jgi:hypothetical protein
MADMLPYLRFCARGFAPARLLTWDDDPSTLTLNVWVADRISLSFSGLERRDLLYWLENHSTTLEPAPPPRPTVAMVQPGGDTGGRTINVHLSLGTLTRMQDLRRRLACDTRQLVETGIRLLDELSSEPPTA